MSTPASISIRKGPDSRELSECSAPRFSVVIPLYNKAPYVQDTLESVFAQTCGSFEVIVVNDGSTDGSVARLAPYLQKITLIHQDNLGPGLARNRGAREARGDWLAFIDADDLWLPTHLAALLKLNNAFPQCDVVACAFDFYQNGRRVEMEFRPDSYSREQTVDYIADPRARGLLFTSSAAVRTRSFHDVGGFGPSWPGEDSDLWIRMAFRGLFAINPRSTVKYMQNQDGLMQRGARSAHVGHDVRNLPTLALLRNAIDRETLHNKRRDLFTFHDSIVMSSARTAIYQGENQLAISCLHALKEWSPRSYAYYYLALCPPPILRFAKAVYSPAARIARRSRRALHFRGRNTEQRECADP